MVENNKTEFDPSLPPAGYKRREELAKRTDHLEEEAEKKYANVGSIPQDSPVLDPEQNREIQDHIHKSHLDIGVDHPYLKTKWVNYVNQHGSMVWKEKADGWQVATVKDFPEARVLVREDGTIRIGDVILMCIRLDEYLKLFEREKEKRLRQQYGIESDIHTLAEQYPNVFSDVHTDSSGGLPNRVMDIVEKRAARRNAAARVVAKTLGNKMKEGPVPGIPIK